MIATVRRVEVLIVGAGPAGLSAAMGCLAHGIDYLVVESGARIAERNHDDQRSLGTGVGGSGLYSDGKFSFFPSATALWRVEDRTALEESWQWFTDTATRFGISSCDLPDLPDLPCLQQPVVGDDTGGRKNYLSLYVCLPDRRRLIKFLEANIAGRMATGTELRRIRFEGGVFRCETVSGGKAVAVEANALIHAGGRFAPVWMAANFSDLRLRFRRVEVGVRVVQKSDTFFLREDGFPDPKLIWKATNGRYEWRTFCCCQDGQVVTTEVQGLLSVSGRADGPPTGWSNVGFNLRVTDPNLAAELWPDNCWLIARQEPAEQNFVSFLSNPANGLLATVLGTNVARLLAEGLEKLAGKYPVLRETPCHLIAPAIEGVGSYPELADNLRCDPYPMWVAGDASGVFRGLTAAMVSGYFAALQAAAYMEAPR